MLEEDGLGIIDIPDDFATENSPHIRAMAALLDYSSR